MLFFHRRLEAGKTVLCWVVLFVCLVFVCLLVVVFSSRLHFMRAEVFFERPRNKEKHHPTISALRSGVASDSARYQERGLGGQCVRSAPARAGCSNTCVVSLLESCMRDNKSARTCATPGVCVTLGGKADCAVNKASSLATIACCAEAGLILTTSVNAPTLSPRTLHCMRFVLPG